MDALMPEDERYHAFDEAVWSRHPDAGVYPPGHDPGGTVTRKARYAEESAE